MSFLLFGVFSQSTTPTDKLYAVHGLLRPAIASAISIDYDKPTQRVARDATLALIRETDIIPHLFWSRPFQDPDLPSWAFNLTQGRTYIEVLCPRKSIFIQHPDEFGPWDADEFFQRQVKHESSGGESWRTLVIKATRMDSVDGVAAYPDYRGTEIARDAKMAATHADFSFTSTRRAEHSYPDDDAVLYSLSKLLGLRFGRGGITLEDLGHSPQISAKRGGWPASITADQIVNMNHTALFLDANANFCSMGRQESWGSFIYLSVRSQEVKKMAAATTKARKTGLPRRVSVGSQPGREEF